MPVKLPLGLPASEELEKENIFVMGYERAKGQDIRPLRILVLNLMPTKEETEKQLIRLLSNTPLQIELTLLRTVTHQSTHTPYEHIAAFYNSYEEIKNENFDGMIVTGAPVENLDYSEVDYWNELCEIFRFSEKHVFSALFICWASQAALKYFYGIEKYPLKEKLSGIYRHEVLVPTHPIVRGFDETFYAPHSRYTEIRPEDVARRGELTLIAASERAGVYLVGDEKRRFFITGHCEYDADTLKNEYLRDVGKGLSPHLPENYFPGDSIENEPKNVWRAHANLLYQNWLNYFVYQQTPYDISKIEDK
ncbi:MAG: homoserine O-succinyltransferase [Clostridia bacterium]|nr:homoserine O-succinyltransferase [Clostridia bacterium]